MNVVLNTLNTASADSNGLIGTSQQIADNKYSPSNHPILKDVGYNINNPRLGTLEHFEPQANNSKKKQGLEYFTRNSPR